MKTQEDIQDEITKSAEIRVSATEAIKDGVDQFPKYRNCEPAPAADALIVLGATTVGIGAGWTAGKALSLIPAVVPLIGGPISRAVDSTITPKLTSVGGVAGALTGTLMVNQHNKECEKERMQYESSENNSASSGSETQTTFTPSFSAQKKSESSPEPIAEPTPSYTQPQVYGACAYSFLYTTSN